MDCGLSDLGFIGFPYTWSNKRQQPATVRARLDRALSSDSWNILFPNATVRHLSFGGSDHSPILIQKDFQGSLGHVPRSRRFRFEAYWAEIPGCEESIREGWTMVHRRQSPMIGRLGRTRISLLKWQKRTLGSVKAAINRIEDEIALLAQEVISESNWNREKDLKVELNSLLKLEETYWRQRSKSHWFINGDRNTAFFHAHASRRRSMNRIGSLRNDEEQLLSTENELQAGITTHFRSMFTSSDPEAEATQAVLSSIPTRLTSSMLRELSMPFTMLEIEQAVKVKQEVSAIVLRLLNEGLMEEGLNHTHIVLIPK
ncbi:hypothetical protein M569_09701, partial [Genlisea aurea]